ncbi:cupin domain-containing protein [Leisingera thetidis]|uniref:cupin domain-containing protein n=1 Tax=Leisingera thetidis TaxID=2930199 RepID=UPI0021F6D6A7|nr:cupin domain-containing protein [Leisingera thetidis]
MNRPAFTKLPDRSVEPIPDDLPGWTKTAGSPSMRTWIEYSSEDESLISGWWEATPGTYHATYDDWEFVHMIEGRIVITAEGEEPGEVGPGDAFVIEAGFKGTWEIKENVLKHFVIQKK